MYKAPKGWNTLQQAYDLLHQGSIALAQVEANGIRIHTNRLEHAIRTTTEKIKKLEEKLQQDEVFSVWRREFAGKANLGSREQLAKVLFEHMGYPATKYTSGGSTGKRRPSADVGHLETVNLRFVKDYIRWQKLQKVKTTYLLGLQRETVGGYLHPVFNLHTVTSFRSSSDAPNLQNLPIRDPEFGRVIRRCVIPRKGNVLAEIDIVGAEVKSIALFHKDVAYIEDITNPANDMHRDQAISCFMLEDIELPPNWWSQKGSGGGKDVRYCSKNLFVFPEFYGSFYIDCARGLWNGMERMKLALPSGVPMVEHLKSKGITSLGPCDERKSSKPGTFEYHIQQCEKKLWQKYSTYAKWREKWYKDYKKRGGFFLPTGFWVSGIYRKNEVINIPNQGTAFHCLLWSLIQLQKWIEEHNYKSKIICEIHDSMLIDVPLDELQDILNITEDIMTRQLSESWKWLAVPMEIEVDVSDQSWFEKEPWIKRDSIWKPKSK